MKVIVQNQGTVNLDKRLFIASGGEGQIFASGQTAYKIYTDPKHMMPLGKIQELSSITDLNVIRPQEIVYDTNKKPIGYTMRFVPNTYALVQLFTKAFRQREGLTHETIQKLIQKLRNIIEHIHDHKILIVDLNEMNFLVNHGFSEIFAIDTDSYQTPSYPATAIMDSIRDRHSKTFNELTDWFAFGIISFQMFVGIHPYKGKHPKVKDLEDRMKGNLSVFNKDVSMPHVCYPLDVIPDSYKQWYKEIFENGKRLPPPEDFQASVPIITAIIHKIVGSNNFDISEVMSLDETIISIYSGANLRILTDSKFYLNKNKNIPIKHPLKIAITTVGKVPIIAKLNSEKLILHNADKNKEISNQIYGQKLMEYNGNLYVASGDNILYVDFMEVGENIIAASNIVASILPNATKIFDGVIIQNLLGAKYVSIFSEPKTHRQIHIKELDKYRIIDAKYDNNILMLIGSNNNIYDRFVIKFSDDWKNYDVRIINNVSPTELNFVVLDKGVAICLNEDEDLEVFSNRISHQNVTVINDPAVTGDIKLHKYGGKLYFSKGENLYSMTMRK